MSQPIKELLPDAWWRIAACVDAYESASGDGFPDLRTFVRSLPENERTSGLLELVKVEFERRSMRGEPRRVEDYLREYPELSNVRSALGELAGEEFLLRSRGGDRPSADEWRSRFPQLEPPETPDQAAIATVPFGVRPGATQPLQERPSAAATDLSSSGPPLPPGGRDLDLATLPSEASALAQPATGDTDATVVSRNAVRRSMTTEHGGTVVTENSAAASKSGSPSAAPSTYEGRGEGPGSTISRYRIQRTLGSGSFGVVYQCRDEELKRDVAIKLPRQGRSGRSQPSQQFLHEAQSAARLRHAGIVTVLDMGQTDDGRAFIVYEYVAGASLQARMELGGYTHREAALWAAEIAEALHHAHKQGVVHRDIKPANVLLDEHGRVKVADFGLAKLDDEFFTDDHGRVLGTLAYMSPEQAAAKSQWASPQSDIYSLGVVLYQMLCRRLPFTKGSTSELLKQVVDRVPSPPRTIDDTIPKALEAVCLKAMAKDPAARYTTAADMAAELRAAVSQSPPRRPIERRLVLAAMGAAALLLLWVFSALLRELDPARRGPVLSAAERQWIENIVKVKPDTPEWRKRAMDDHLLEIHAQRGGSSGSTFRLSDKDVPLGEGDRVQVHVTLTKPQYVYLFWCDASGGMQRLWPVDASKQEKVTRVVSPDSSDEDSWWQLDAQDGYEMALLAVSDEKLDDRKLRLFEQRRPFRPARALEFRNVVVIGSSLQERVSRGLSGVVQSPKDPLRPEFKQAVEREFDAYYGLAFRHQ